MLRSGVAGGLVLFNKCLEKKPCKSKVTSLAELSEIFFSKMLFRYEGGEMERKAWNIEVM